MGFHRCISTRSAGRAVMRGNQRRGRARMGRTAPPAAPADSVGITPGQAEVTRAAMAKVRAALADLQGTQDSGLAPQHGPRRSSGQSQDGR